MKLIKNKDLKCLKCNVFICCENEGLTRIFNHHFCWNCGEPIEWVEERTEKEILDELVLEAISFGGCGVEDDSEETLKKAKNIDSLKQELLKAFKSESKKRKPKKSN